MSASLVQFRPALLGPSAHSRLASRVACSETRNECSQGLPDVRSPSIPNYPARHRANRPLDAYHQMASSQRSARHSVRALKYLHFVVPSSEDNSSPGLRTEKSNHERSYEPYGSSPVLALGYICSVPPSATESLKESSGIRIAIGLCLDEINHGLLIGLFSV